MSYLLASQNHQILFESHVPYRIVQKQSSPWSTFILLRACDSDFEPRAPAILSVENGVTSFSPFIPGPFKTSLNFGDEIYVRNYRPISPNIIPSSSDLPIINEKGKLESQGVAILSRKFSSIPTCFEMAFITKVEKNYFDDDNDDDWFLNEIDGDNDYVEEENNYYTSLWMTDIKTLSKKLIPPEFVENIPKAARKVGTLLQFDYQIIPIGSYVSNDNTLVIVPAALATFCPENANLCSKEELIPSKLSLMENLTRDQFSNYLIAGIAFYEILFRKDLDESILSTPLVWNFAYPKNTSVLYQGEGIETGDQFKIYKNTLFKKGGFAVLTRHNINPINPENKFVPIFIKISYAKYLEDKTEIKFIIDAFYLLRKWNLQSFEELKNGIYKIEPTDILSHLRGFNAKLKDNNYILSKLNNNSSARGRILEQLLPPPPSPSNNNHNPHQRPSPPFVNLAAENHHEASSRDDEYLDFDKIKQNLEEIFLIPAELSSFQKAIKIIVKHYSPNFIIATNETLISLLPALGNHVTNIYVEKSEKSTFFDIFAMVVECSKLQQLIIVGDLVGYPSNPRIRIDEPPACFNTIMRSFNNQNQNYSNMAYFELNEIFYMNSKIVSTLKDLFYPNRNISSLRQISALKTTNFLRRGKIPLAFFDQDGESLHVHPTTQNNKSHTWRLLEILNKLLATTRNDPQKITILCYYKGQKEDIIEELRNRNINGNIYVSCIDSYNAKTDVAIVVATRTLGNNYPRKYAIFQKNGLWVFKRLPMGCVELGDAIDYFHFLFDQQRLLKALSRASKATFIIGSQDLLNHNETWRQLIQVTKDEGNFVKESFIPEYLKVLEPTNSGTFRRRRR